MSNLLAKIGEFDNISLYEHYCDTTADLKNIPKNEILLGSTAIVIEGESGGFEAYIADSEKNWIPIITGTGGGGGGGITPTGTLEITENGIYDITEKAEVDVNVPNPSTGELEIIENGTYDVTELATAIVNVTTGSGDSTADESKPVHFYDYDGTLVYSYTPEEFAALTAMPENPDHSSDEIPLTSQGWNWNLADAQAYVAEYGILDVGQLYVTADGKTHAVIYVDPELPVNRMNISLSWAQTVQNGVTIDWGDGSPTETFPGILDYNYYNYGVFCSHAYTVSGLYDITLTVTDGTMALGATGFDEEEADSDDLVYGGCNFIRARYYMRNMLRELRLGSGLTPNVSNGFINCGNLKYVTMPENVGGAVFTNCGSLRCLIISNTEDSYAIPFNAFANSSSCVHIILPKNVTSIASSAFSQMKNLSRLVIPKGVKRLNSGAFSGCSNLNTLVIPSTVTVIDASACYGCGFSSINLPANITSIQASTFATCTSLIKIIIPNKVTAIRDQAFYLARNLLSITIPKSVTSIGASAFMNCYSLTECHIQATTPPTIQATTFSANKYGTLSDDCIIYVPYSEDHSVLNAYKTANIWKQYASRMQEEFV